MPLNITDSASKQVLRIFDQRFFRPSTLDDGRKEELTSLFGKTVSRIDASHARSYSIVFRRGMMIGANAFALPSGIIVITDELVALSANDDELMGVFAHEIYHVKERHALRSILQGTGVFLLATLLTGDVTSIANFASFLPALLIEKGYSRDFERDADREAASLLISLGKGTRPFQDILSRIDASHPRTLKLGVFSTHPETVHRIDDLKKLEQRPGRQGRSSRDHLPRKNVIWYNARISGPETL
jgi:Zn-dependent protease with chaperone function